MQCNAHAPPHLPLCSYLSGDCAYALACSLLFHFLISKKWAERRYQSIMAWMALSFLTSQNDVSWPSLALHWNFPFRFTSCSIIWLVFLSKCTIFWTSVFLGLHLPTFFCVLFRVDAHCIEDYRPAFFLKAVARPHHLRVSICLS